MPLRMVWIWILFIFILYCITNKGLPATKLDAKRKSEAIANDNDDVGMDLNIIYYIVL